jgi:hypothetical protein
MRIIGNSESAGRILRMANQRPRVREFFPHLKSMIDPTRVGSGLDFKETEAALIGITTA